MVIKIRFARGTSISPKPAKNPRIAGALSTCSTLGAISCGTLGCWRLGQDLGWAGDFVFDSGLLSHWQVWLSAAGVLQYGAWKLARHARTIGEQKPPAVKRTDQHGTVQAAVNS